MIGFVAFVCQVWILKIYLDVLTIRAGWIPWGYR